jgi:lipopolysaccharide export system protein LptA
LLGVPAIAQRNVKLIHSDLTSGGRKDGQRYFQASGDVKFMHEGTEIWCDSAFFYKKDNRLEAMGHIRIFDTLDSTDITANQLTYEESSRFAKLRGNVIYKEDSIELRTEFLDYNMISKSANYFNGGRIDDGSNILNSKKGYYDSQGKWMAFKNEVVLVNPQNTLKADSLYYDLRTKIARTIGPTEIISSDGSIVNSVEGGEFDMVVNQTKIRSGEIETESYVLKGDDLFYDRSRGSNRAIGNVFMYSKNENLTIIGNEAENDERLGITKIFGNPVMKKVFEGDTLYLAADTLISVDDSLDVNKKLLAFHNVRFYRFDLQGKSDSLVYALSDSVLFLYNDPVLWSEGNQIEADSINILFRNNQIDKLNLNDNSFMVLQDTMKNFNQLKGKDMVAFFLNNRINRLEVTGNSECLFYALEEEENGIMGINRILCSSMTIRFIDNQADNMSFYQKPEAVFIPPHELKEDDKQLKGFNWREGERPTLETVMSPPIKEEPVDDAGVEATKLSN